MRKITFTLCVMFIFGCACMSFAQDLPTCDDLVEIAVTLDDLREVFDEVENIEEGDEFDDALGEVLVALQELAEIENDNRLYSAVNSMVNAYNDMDKDAFSNSFVKVDDALGNLYARDCSTPSSQSDPNRSDRFLLGAVTNWGTNKAYFFSGDLYCRYDIKADRTDSGYPKNIDQNTWPGMPWGDVDAIVNWGNGKAYFFRGDQYIRYDLSADRVDPGYPKDINQNTWPGVPWKHIDAAVNWGNGKAYFFKGDQYIRYDIRADKADPGYPKDINQNTWPGVPWTTGLDAIVNWGNGKAYFFKGDQYVRYDIRADRTDPGYPKDINQNTWPGLSF